MGKLNGTFAMMAVLALSGACTETPEPYEEAPLTETTPAPDRGFVEEVVTASNKEIEVSQLAAERAASADVKAYAEMLINDHREANERLDAVTSQLQLSVAPEQEQISEAREELIDLTGAEFDRAYIDMMVSGHEDVVSTVEDKINGSGNPQVQQWASETLPTLRQHLQRAREIQDSMGGD
ncbi:MAG: DUF4142 domain-containing protein [Acidobacteria bacterium]|nr:DUF4142 domain-containing protein [Acidobacteriota bacterium]